MESYSCENGKYLVSIMDDSAIMCDEVIESYDEDVEAKSIVYRKTWLGNMYFNFNYSANMLNIGSRGFNRAQYCVA